MGRLAFLATAGKVLRMLRAVRGWGTLAALAGLALAPGAAAAAPLVRDVPVHAGTGLGEPVVRVNPRDPGNVIIGENNTGVSVSRDRGATWRQVSMPNPGDNVLGVAPDGTFLY